MAKKRGEKRKSGEKSSGKKVSASKAKKKEDKDLNESWLKTNVSGFDKLIDPGIPEGTSTLLEGGPGSGKTILGLTMANEFCKQGKKVLYMSFEEPPHRLKHHMENFGWDPKKYEEKGNLKIERFNALDISRSVEALLSEAKKELLIEVQPVLIPKDFEPDVVIVDSLTSIGSAFSGEEERFRIYMEQLFRYLEGHQITSFLIRETAIPTHTGRALPGRPDEAVSFLSDAIVSIYNVVYDNGKRDRAIEVIKMRGVDIDRKIVLSEINKKKGFVVYPDKAVKGKNYKLT